MEYLSSMLNSLKGLEVSLSNLFKVDFKSEILAFKTSPFTGIHSPFGFVIPQASSELVGLHLLDGMAPRIP
jgi:hypothetical protein